MIVATFELIPRQGPASRFDLAADLRPELERIDGFVSVERFESLTQPGKFLSLPTWRDEDAARAWRDHVQDLDARREGRSEVFDDYRIRVAFVPRDYGMPARRLRRERPRAARVAAMIADPTRSRMPACRLDGQVASAGELARAAGVQPSTASAHLDKLVGAGLVACEPRGRHHWFRRADADVAPWAQLQREGRLVETGDRGPRSPRPGERWLAGLRFAPAPARSGQRLAYGCLDSSQRRDHMAGSLARQLLDHFVAAGWLRRRAPGDARPGGHRVLDVTVSGRRDLLPRLGVDLMGDG